MGEGDLVSGQLGFLSCGLRGCSGTGGVGDDQTRGQGSVQRCAKAVCGPVRCGQLRDETGYPLGEVAPGEVEAQARGVDGHSATVSDPS